MLAELLPAEIFVVLLVFCRVGAAFMLLPGVGEPFVSPRVRLAMALLVSLLAAPVVRGELPAQPESGAILVLLIAGEVTIGLFLGALTRFFIAAMNTAGMVIAYMTSLANAFTNDPTANEQASIAGAFLSLVAMLVVFALDLHHLLLKAVIDSYLLFVPGEMPPVGDFADLISTTVAKTFLLALQIAAPFIGAGCVFYLGLGLLARLMPQVQIFFIAMPLQIALGLVVLFAALPIAIQWFVRGLTDTLSIFTGFP